MPYKKTKQKQKSLKTHGTNVKRYETKNGKKGKKKTKIKNCFTQNVSPASFSLYIALASVDITSPIIHHNVVLNELIIHHFFIFVFFLVLILVFFVYGKSQH